MSKHHRQRGSRQKRYMKAELIRQHGPGCMWCGDRLTVETATLEHLVPVSEGGGWGLDNLRIACRPCNLNRGTLSVEEYREMRGLIEKFSRFAPEAGE